LKSPLAIPTEDPDGNDVAGAKAPPPVPSRTETEPPKFETATSGTPSPLKSAIAIPAAYDPTA